MTDSEAIAILEGHQSTIGSLRNRVRGSQEFIKWRRDTRVAIQKIFGDQSGHIQEFASIRYSPQVISRYRSDAALHTVYLHGLESADAILESMVDEIKQFGLPDTPVPEAIRHDYISQSRLNELRALYPANFDLQRLIRLCEEIDINFRNECWFAVAALTREVLDHVPPIFGYGKFEHVANNYGGNGSSFKRSMQHLQRSLRNIADAHLHTPIRQSESLPTATQVNFGPDLDVLLGEIVRLLS